MKATFTGEPMLVMNNLYELLADHDGPIQVDVKDYKPIRSLSQNSLYWVWLRVLAAKFSRPDDKLTDEDMHDMMRHMFLGYEDKQISKTVIKDQLKSTTKLDKGEFHYYMNQIEAWAAEHGVLVPIPADSQYQQLREYQNQ